jgi:large subunit ribosomal protein L23
MVNPYEIILMPWITEKSMDARSTYNRLEFVVHRSATKGDIAAAVEILFDAEVAKVNVRNTKHGKLASVRLAEGYHADEAAMRLGAF